ncbi:MAG: TRAP transporter substrate-binding protein [Thermodesulfobacteriota bacterium]
MKRIWWIFTAMILTLGLLTGPVLAADPIVLKLAHITAPNGMLDKKAQKFAELMSAKSGGQVKVEIYPAQQLGNIKEIMQGISMGTMDMAMEAESFMDAFDKDFSIFTTPFMFSREELTTNAYLLEVRERVRKKTGIRTLPGFAFRPAFHLWTQKRQIMTPAELKGIKLRVWQSKALVDTWNSLGATATPLPWGEVYMALSQGVVNGLVHNIVQVRDEKFNEQLNFCTKLDWLNLYDVTWINDAKFSSLGPNVQKALEEAAKESAAWLVDFGQGLEAEAQKDCEKGGVVFAKGDRSLWLNKAKAEYPQLEKGGLWSAGLLKKLGKE